MLAKCKKFFDRKEKFFEYERQLYDLAIECHAYEDTLDYVRKVWSNDYKEKFIAVWTNKVIHFGNVTTNRYSL